MESNLVPYDIKISYQTGDSFHTSDEEQLLGLKTESLEVAKDCLRRIKEHYQYYEAQNKGDYRVRWMNKEEKAAHDRILESAKKAPWYVEEFDFSLNFDIGEGKTWRVNAFWCGYFEKLYGAEIVTEGDTDMKFTVD